jgi:hypothetical protein
MPLNGNGGATPSLGGSGPPPSTSPAAYNETIGAPPPVAAPPGGMTPSAMMRAMLTPQPGTQLRGQPITLMEVVSGARSRSDQTQRVEAYWDLCSSVADYYLGLRELTELQRFAQRGGQIYDQVQGRTGTALRAAVASQMRLASLTGRGGAMLLPADPPHCAAYSTHYEQIFGNGGSAEARELAALLPLRFKELSTSSAEVKESEDYYNTAATRSAEEGLHAMELLALKRRAFVQIARDYNRRIARYSELATPEQVSAQRLTAMLIHSNVSTATKTSAPSAPVNQRSSNRPAPPTTFMGGASPAATSATVGTTGGFKKDDALKPASDIEPASPSGEHSLLVQPQ